MGAMMTGHRRNGADSIIIVMLGMVLLSSPGCARRSGGNEHEDAMRVVADVSVFVDYNKDMMMVNMDSIAEISELLKETALLRLGRLDYRAKAILDQKDFRPLPNEYLIKIRIDDFHPGPSKSMDISYELSKSGSVLLKDKMRVSTMKGSSKLARVMGRQIVDIIDDRIQGGGSIGNGENGRKSKPAKKSSADGQ
jgi:hypothetical protein